MGEIGYNRHEYLYELTHCDLLLIERGYERRHTHMWSASRWETYHIMAAQIGTDGLKQAGVEKPSDLIRLPGDKTTEEEEYDSTLPTAEDIERMRREMMEENAAAEAAARKNTEA